MEYGFCLGSNLGDRLAVFREARERMLAFPDARFVAQSPVYETEPVGVKPEYQDLSYLNAVLILHSDKPAGEWLKRLQQVERDLGRERREDRYAPRTLDIDMLYCDDAVIDSGGLQVPHPRWAQRRFVVQPLADVRPEKQMPGSGRSVRETLDNLQEDKAVTLYAKDW